MNEDVTPWNDTWIDIGGEGRSTQRVATKNNRGKGSNVTLPLAG